MNYQGLLDARDKILDVDSNDKVAVDAVIAEIEPISKMCKEYLEAEDVMMDRLMQAFAKAFPQKEKACNLTNVS